MINQFLQWRLCYLCDVKNYYCATLSFELHLKFIFWRSRLYLRYILVEYVLNNSTNMPLEIVNKWWHISKKCVKCGRYAVKMIIFISKSCHNFSYCLIFSISIFLIKIFFKILFPAFLNFVRQEKGNNLYFPHRSPAIYI